MTTTIMERHSVLYCDACGMPPEYCEYGPDYETHCTPWLQKNHPDIYADLKIRRKKSTSAASASEAATSEEQDNRNGQDEAELPTEPWTIEQRLIAFYTKYQPDKLDGVSAILDKYAGKESKLFQALVKKYGPEPDDPYYANANNSDDDSDDSSSSLDDDMAKMSVSDKKKRRGASAKAVNKTDTRVVIQKISRNKRKAVTTVIGMDTVPDIKLKDVSKAFSKRFAGSSSVKDLKGSTSKKEIIVQGDHMDAVAEMIVEKFHVPPQSVFLDIDGEFVPYQ
mmetsp:Transcript_17437/g.24620  ORF Transcript_17437/g.24620 Transcript_17437/m.24620 type:complete len:280 (+) Transcript_17437:38-877(+)|eukprot:CAMPEP_0184857350 /NCGR_PEP_ID=MMETSP0580-20130426/2520_1 /TAXON_ID=1118495 /ORGANISM="Dactyliosolen fragilissimus" /LENGTH=279 /DNA_ID=CAMNT_0027352907 /DNA_START=9 /DNA_END=848 /DNA_ORIENTATION=-